jgi:NADPH:quinone reductase-like Zn-dependent oxidoreductase
MQATVNMAQIMMRRLTLSGSTLRPQSTDRKALLADEIHRYVWPDVEAGRLKPVMDEIFALKDAAKAHAHMEAGDHIGKIVLKVE